MKKKESEECVREILEGERQIEGMEYCLYYIYTYVCSPILNKQGSHFNARRY